MTCPRDWPSLQSIRLPKSRTLPVVLSREQVQTLLARTQLFHYRAFFQVCYTCGLRLGDGRDLHYHPHVHYVVAGGGLNADATAWKAARLWFIRGMMAFIR